MKKNILFILLLTLIIAGCSSAVEPVLIDKTSENKATEVVKEVQNLEETDAAQEVETTSAIENDDQLIAVGENTQTIANEVSLFENSYREFNQEEFNLAKESDYYIVLDFYSTWCPKCNTEDSILSSSFDNLENIVIFKVNHGDPETTDAEEALAEKFDISNRASGIVLKGQSEISRYSGHKNEQEYRELFDSLI